MKNFDTEAALRLSLEIEGLIVLAQQRHESLPEEARALLAEKSSLLASMLAYAAEMPSETPAEAAEPAEAEPVPEPEAVTEPMPEAVTEPMPEPVPEPVPEPRSVTPPSDEASSRTVRLEEKIAGAAAAGDLRKALTINDRYLFCRELFDMSNNVLNRTLETVSRMESFEQARDYVLGTLELDPENPATDYFLSFISRNFKR